MKLKDIVNRDVATIATCESEPIHIPGSIQPHGVLIAGTEEGVIEFCSANCNKVFGIDPSALLQQSLTNLSPELWNKIQPLVSGETEAIKPFSVHFNATSWDVFVTRSASSFIIEFESGQPDGYLAEELFDQTTRFVSLIERSKSLQDLCQKIAEEIRSITGYDRVMIYRFDKEYNGQVFAESRHLKLEPLLDLHYPHTDIPPQARDLYLQNLMRLIADVHYEPVPLLTMDNGEAKNLDLSISVLRSVSPIHVQYLKNMGVSATLTISLLLEGRLWGLITCHHNTPLHLPFVKRKAALLQGHFLTSQIKVRQVAEEYEVNVVVEAHLQQLLNTLPQDSEFSLKFAGFTSLLAVANASGAAVLYQGKLYDKGAVPPADKTRLLFNWLSENVSGLQYNTSCLRERYPGGESISRYASGILYYKLGNAKTDAIIWFREEVERTINWAGNPHHAVKKDPVNGLSPRSSFAIFRERVRFQSKPWRISETNAASRFASALLNQFHLEYLRREEASQRMLNDKLQKANEELSNINWITTHDLKEPLRKILLFSSRLVSQEERSLSDSLLDSITKIQASAQRMRFLVDDIISYSMTSDKSAAFATTDLNSLAAEVMEEYSEELRESGGNCFIEKLPVVSVIPYQIRQLFGNLFGNAIKFAKKDSHLQIEISYATATGNAGEQVDGQQQFYHLIKFKDNGIGFEEQKSNRLFDIFYRLHDAKTYAGTGIGLAICRRIVENHGGFITASGQPGVGASFHIYLPEKKL